MVRRFIVMAQSKIKTFFGGLLALTIISTCTILGALTTLSINWVLAWALLDADIALAPWLNIVYLALFYCGGPIGFVIGVIWARGVLRRD